MNLVVTVAVHETMTHSDGQPLYIWSVDSEDGVYNYSEDGGWEQPEGARKEGVEKAMAVLEKENCGAGTIEVINNLPK